MGRYKGAIGSGPPAPQDTPPPQDSSPLQDQQSSSRAIDCSCKAIIEEDFTLCSRLQKLFSSNELEVTWSEDERKWVCAHSLLAQYGGIFNMYH